MCLVIITHMRILVLMDFSFLQSVLKSYLTQRKHVSILVLMDFSFLPYRICLFMSNAKSFNPCSYGFFVLTVNRHTPINSILVWFQSLFLWIFRSYKMKYVIEFMFYSLGFNPCSYGFFVLTRLNIQTCIFQWFCIHFAF